MPGMWCVGLVVMRCFADPGGAVSAVECPPLRNWPAGFQKQLAAELRAVPKGSAMSKVVVQAIGDRDVIRACRQRQKAGP